MPDFSSRSYQKELLDRDDIPFSDIKRNMQELDIINTFLGGHAITITGLKKFNTELKQNQLTVCEIGCGGGDNLKAIYNWCNNKNIPVKLIGIDINADCISYAKENCSNISDIGFITSDYRIARFGETKPDIIFSSLFTHHLNDEEFVEMLHWSGENSQLGFFINDLHRHFLAYYSIKILTAVFSKSYLVKNDAPLSVLRGFRKQEIKRLLKSGDIPNHAIEWKWAFRWLITVKH
jgi:2-polyprenyl-3-methyl-5-hydroxy-6-metoxy-1,4-benzoquinol methylase